MLRWLQRHHGELLPAFVPGSTPLPFEFPVIEVNADSTVTVHRSATSFGMLGEDQAQKREVPEIEVFAGCGSAWRPTRIIAAVDTGKRLFGRSLVLVLYEFGQPRTYDLSELRAAVVRSIQNDPDDLWSQRKSPDEVVAAVERAASFAELVTAAITHSGQAVEKR